VDQADSERIQRVIQDEAERIFTGSVRRVSLLPSGDLDLDEQDRELLNRGGSGPDEVVGQIVLSEPPGTRPEPARAPQLLQAFRNENGPAIKQFRQGLAQRLPELRHIRITFEDATGQRRGGGGLLRLVPDEGRPADGDLTAVMVRLRAEELDTVDTLITAGIAGNRAEAVRWALARIRERPAFEQLRVHTREIERLKTDF
jgi:hypothetical protein